MRVRTVLALLACASGCGVLGTPAPRALTPTGTEGDTCEQRLYYPKQYVAYKCDQPLVVDGKLDEKEWQEVGWTDDFVDISTSVVPRFATRAKMRWDDEFLYVGAELEEPDIWANLTQHNEVIYHDNDFEVFVDSDGSTHNYKEFEINALNYTWDLLLNKPYDDGGHENSTRVDPAYGWEMQPPLHSRVHAEGEVNNPDDARPGRKWTVEIAFPLAKLAEFKHSTVPPRNNDLWRINFSRVEWHVVVVDGRFEKDPHYPHEDNWVWSPQGFIQMHYPDTWGFLQFSTGPVNTTAPIRAPDWSERSVAMDLYHAQHAFAGKNNGSFSKELEALQPLAPHGLLDGECADVVGLRVADDGFLGVVEGKRRGYVVTVRDDRFLTSAAV